MEAPAAQPTGILLLSWKQAVHNPIVETVAVHAVYASVGLPDFPAPVRSLVEHPMAQLSAPVASFVAISMLSCCRAVPSPAAIGGGAGVTRRQARGPEDKEIFIGAEVASPAVARREADARCWRQDSRPGSASMRGRLAR